MKNNFYKKIFSASFVFFFFVLIFSFSTKIALALVQGEACYPASSESGECPTFTDYGSCESAMPPCVWVGGSSGNGDGGAGGGGGPSFRDDATVELLPPFVPVNVTPGADYPFKVRVTNTGTTDWYYGDYYKFVQKSNFFISPSYGHLPYAVTVAKSSLAPALFSILPDYFIKKAFAQTGLTPPGFLPGGCTENSGKNNSKAGGCGGNSGGGGKLSFSSSLKYVDWDFVLSAPNIPGEYTLNMQMLHKGGAFYKINLAGMPGPLFDTYFGQTGIINFKVKGDKAPGLCVIRDFSADNLNLKKNNLGTTLRYLVDIADTTGSIVPTIEATSPDLGKVLPTLISSNSSSGVYSTGGLAVTQTYRLNCGKSFQLISVNVTSPGDKCDNLGANNFGRPLPCTFDVGTITGINTPECSSGVYNPSFSFTGPAGWMQVSSMSDFSPFSLKNQPTNPQSYPFGWPGEPNLLPDTDYWVRVTNGDVNGASVKFNVPSVCASPEPPSGTISAISCLIPSGDSTCDSLVSWTTKDLTSGATEVVRNNPNNTNVSALTSNINYRETIKYGQTTFYLYHNIEGVPTKLAETTITTSCAPGGIWDGVKCNPTGSLSGTLNPTDRDVTSCEIKENEDSCIINFTWKTLNFSENSFSSVTRNPNSFIMADKVSNPPSGYFGSKDFFVKYDTSGTDGVETYYLYNSGNARELAQFTVTSSCATGNHWNGIKCIKDDDGLCKNGATNPPTCTIIDKVCINGATNPPTCTCVGANCIGGCINGATNPPTCTIIDKVCINGATNPPTCTIIDKVCINGATNPPTCTIIDNKCLNGATNPPTCTCIGPNCIGGCINGAINPPLCTQSIIPIYKER